MEQQVTYQGVAPWMIWVAVVVGIVACIALAAIWKVVEIGRSEKKRKQAEIEDIAGKAVKEKADKLADEISQKVMVSMAEKFDAIDRKLNADKIRIENAEKRSREHDEALERIEKTLESVDANIKDMHDGFIYLSRAEKASIDQLRKQDGGNDELDEAARELDRYLTNRPIVPMNENRTGGK